jgi:UDP-N-acetylmuramate--alanine ligase
VCLQAAGRDPSFAIGGALNESGTSAHHGTGELFVAEADESDRSFLAFTPDLAVVTNVELDHHDAYASLDETLDVFAAFLERRVEGAPVVLCEDDEGARRLATGVRGPVLRYGTSAAADLRIVGVRPSAAATQFRLAEGGDDLGEFEVRVPGPHNVRNATAAVAAARWAGVPLDAVRDGLRAFGGAQRRFQRLGEAGGVGVVDDYAHHPTEIDATLGAARQAHPAGRVVAAFQPHRYSRTAPLAAELGRSLAGADLVVVTDVYGSGEAPIPGVDGALVADAARSAGADVRYVPSVGDLPQQLAELARPGDLVLTLGAGDITEAGPVLLELLREAE